MEILDHVHGLRRIVLFQPSELGIYTDRFVNLGADPRPAFRPISPTTILEKSGALAALNGPMFGVCSGQNLPDGNAQYAASHCDVLEYRHFDSGDHGVDQRGMYPSRGLTFSVLGDGTTRVMHGDQVAEGAKVAVQGYPPLVENGRSVAGDSPNTERVQRSAFAIMADGRMAFVVGVGSMPDFATRLVDAGVIWALYTDGGGSTALVTAEGLAGSSERRPVPSWLIVRKSSNAGWWVLGGVALVAAWLVWG